MTNWTMAEPLHFSYAEMGLLAALVIASGAMFLLRLKPIAFNIWRSKKDPAGTLAPLNKRVWAFFWEVLCQAKVIQQRPLPGIAHAFVFWGFLAFVLVSVNHFATGMRVGFLQHAGFLGTFYFGFAGVWAALVAVSIAGLFIRRFFIRPTWLGQKSSYESGVMCVIIFGVMATYIGAFFVSDTGAAVKFLWWTHTLTLLAFLPLIPH